MGILQRAGYAFTSEPEEADVMIVNTCGFINDAKKESIDTIFETATLKDGKLQGVVVTGCLSKRYKDVLFDEIPEADVFLGTENYHHIVEAVETAFRGERRTFFETENINYENEDRVLTTYPHSAYIKIAEGCDNRCAYCAIPFIRGNYRSRTMESIVDEAKILVSRGVKEITLIAQDTTQYGVDIYGKARLPELLKKVAAVKGVAWLRVLYSYPERVTDELLETIYTTPNIVNYLDMPIQHFSDSVLKAMNRKSSYASVTALLKKLREHYPDMTLRTTLLVGFPGESKQDFDRLLKSVKETEFDRLGCFAFSREEGTKAFDMPETVSEKEKEKRREKVMAAQADISLAKNKACIGETIRVIIDEYDDDIFMYIARSEACAPESDGKVYVSSPEPLKIGEFYDVIITNAEYHDLMGEINE